jgi:hypothetical protein
MNPSTQPTQRRMPCQNLRSKEMYYQGADQQDDEFSSGVYWCMLTHENFGPDGQPTGRKECCDGRGCFAG